ncbi:hypothetical protein [Streptomyces glebosus]|uniref:hypothetical protein n=1 Tax=Streptomyces glebosus TaxID=249580 RepID=UPI00167DF455|nr:hypothetical protein [Streptomyces glebosus]
MINSDQDQGVLGHDGPVGRFQAHAGDAGLKAGQDGDDGAGMSGVGVEVDVGVEGWRRGCRS